MKQYAIILAAGKGTRFGEMIINKTALTFNNKSLIKVGVENIKDIFDKVFIVIGHKNESVIEALLGEPVKFITQKEQLGTGHAVLTAIDYLVEQNDIPDSIFIANGDHLFMIDKWAINELVQNHLDNVNDATILTTIHEQPQEFSNGRIIKNNNHIIKIVEKVDFDEQIINIKELNTGTYIFNFKYIDKFFHSHQNLTSKELYITDACISRNNKVQTVNVPYKLVGSGVNTKLEFDEFLRKYHENSSIME